MTFIKVKLRMRIAGGVKEIKQDHFRVILSVSSLSPSILVTSLLGSPLPQFISASRGSCTHTAF